MKIKPKKINTAIFFGIGIIFIAFVAFYLSNSVEFGPNIVLYKSKDCVTNYTSSCNFMSRRMSSNKLYPISLYDAVSGTINTCNGSIFNCSRDPILNPYASNPLDWNCNIDGRTADIKTEKTDYHKTYFCWPK